MLRLKLLGTAAGGGFPQWNCACTLCSGSRQNPSALPPRSQLQALVSDGAGNRFLINASPDLRQQIEAEPALQPHPSRGKRNTPIDGILLTTADLDQVLGLLLLREFQPLRVYTPAPVWQVLQGNSFFKMLQRLPGQLTWTEITPNQSFTLGADIRCTPLAFGLVLESAGRRVAYTPSLPAITEDLLALYESCDVILVDGTFWSDSELSQTQDGTPLARAIGHLPMSGPDGTICLLKEVKRPEKVFIHINNTNPVLDPRSPERQEVEAAGWQVPEDGWRWNY